MNYASAGHPPAIICRTIGEVEMLEFGQMPLAVLEMQDFEEHHTRLEVGDKLVLYTDGISEARHGVELFDLEGIRQFIAEHSNLSANEMAYELLEAAVGWAQGKLSDDAAVVVIERNKASL